MGAPPLWATLLVTLIESTVLLHGAYRFRGLLSFCQSASSSGNYSGVKNTMLIIFYAYGPTVAVSITFIWVGYSLDWSAAYAFLIMPFVALVLFLAVVLMTKNDISNFVDVQRAARAKFPYQTVPPPLVVTQAPATAVIPIPQPPLPPPLPYKDEDAL